MTDHSPVAVAGNKHHNNKNAMSSLTRAFTNRRIKGIDLKEKLHRHSTTKTSSSSRPVISGPIELTHTTNMISYNSPSIGSKTLTPSVESPVTSDSDQSIVSPSVVSTPSTSPEASPLADPVEKVTESGPEPNHLSCYFLPPGQQLPPDPQAPAIPKRAPSHTKKASIDLATARLSKDQHALAKKASLTLSRSSQSSSTSRAKTPSATFSATSSTPSMPTTPVYEQPTPAAITNSHESHPFGQELAQVTEIAEEYGVLEKLGTIEEEERELMANGYCKFSADIYLSEVENILPKFFHEPLAMPSAHPIWI